MEVPEMVTTLAKLLVTTGFLLVLSGPLLAHHPFASEYDWKKPVTLTGKITKIEWTNPHAHLFMDVRADGKTLNWNFELGGMNALQKAGWNKEIVKVGDMVTVDGWRALAKDNAANMKSLKLPDGRELSAASSIGDPEASASAAPSAEKK
jgi:hypothetical protein